MDGIPLVFKHAVAQGHLQGDGKGDAGGCSAQATLPWLCPRRAHVQFCARGQPGLLPTSGQEARSTLHPPALQPQE